MADIGLIKIAANSILVHRVQPILTSGTTHSNRPSILDEPVKMGDQRAELIAIIGEGDIGTSTPASTSTPMLVEATTLSLRLTTIRIFTASCEFL